MCVCVCACGDQNKENAEEIWLRNATLKYFNNINIFMCDKEMQMNNAFKYLHILTDKYRISWLSFKFIITLSIINNIKL